MNERIETEAVELEPTRVLARQLGRMLTDAELDTVSGGTDTTSGGGDCDADEA